MACRRRRAIARGWPSGRRSSLLVAIVKRKVVLWQGKLVSELARKTPQAIHRTLEGEEKCLVQTRVEKQDEGGAAGGATQHDGL